MPVHTGTFSLRTKVGSIVNVSDEVQAVVTESGLKAGIVTVFCPGSTGGISTVEFEPGLVKTDIPEFLQKIIPEGPSIEYAHHQTWHDHNGGGHLRSFLVKPSMTIPFTRGRLMLGTWQQVVFLEFDEKPRHREIICQVVGE
ncbi:MAG: secondary thiamine-phosphate synthase enzyme YjbQ [Promethearchaeota archaeon]